MDNSFETALHKTEAAIREAVPRVVRRHRAAGIFTWRQVHQIESEVIAELSSTGLHSAQMLRMLRSSELMGYPKDDRGVSLEGNEAVPVVFSQIHKAWHRVD